MTNKETNIQCKEFYVDGMHCAACELLLEKRISTHEKVDRVTADLNTKKITIEGNFDDEQDLEKLASEFTSLVQREGYTVMTEEPERKRSSWEDFLWALPIALVFIFAFVFLQKMGLINAVNTTGANLSYPVIFLIGVVASLSSCMAVVGGIVLSMAATYAKESRTGRKISQLSFHISRIVAFFILGGVLGILGANLKLSPVVYTILEVIIAIVMIILALNMMDIFPVLKKLQPRMPKFLSSRAYDVQKFNKGNIITPLLVGIASFFLPCGFTQSMQLYALSTGTFWNGAMTMLIFALGTFPALVVISFVSVSLSKSNKAGIFFKTAGIIVLFFALINLLGALAIAGVIPPILNL